MAPKTPPVTVRFTKKQAVFKSRKKITVEVSGAVKPGEMSLERGEEKRRKLIDGERFVSVDGHRWYL